MNLIDEWPERDRPWATRYMVAVSQPEVSSAAIDARTRELISALREADTPADALFGDPGEIAEEDVRVLGTNEEAVSASEGGGARQGLNFIGTALTFLGVSSALVMLTRGVWRMDVELGPLCIVFGILGAAIAANLAWTLFVAGRTGWTLVVGAGGLAFMAGCIWFAATVGPGHLLIAGVPFWVLMIGMTLPGVLVLLVARLVPRRPLRAAWADDQWLRRFRGAMRSQGLSGELAREHERSVRAGIDEGEGGYYAEFGHPVVLARSLAMDDNPAAIRRWRWSSSFQVAVPLLMCVLVSFSESFGAWRSPAMIFLFVSGMVTAYTSWRHRPEVRQR
ncbi:hypothetical protein CVS30_14825 [Arthrobacter psychrolactophilus]|uniref:Uncharacterized protein n=1 Tax=Arthrobacter psychrolactophilus TaxID=92442 RepID=A0A2V5ILQ8_9MICC|nr:hypothetical protein [Arthrobacter psychrolactophilus]PYI37545.1 hypothetical protein CVS30_14825 [Arthrobacter psychrolactophilus]